MATNWAFGIGGLATVILFFGLRATIVRLARGHLDEADPLLDETP